MKFFIVLVTCTFITISANAQDPQLFENTWYLHYITIDDADLYPPPDDGFVNLDNNFNEAENRFYARFCDIMNPLVEYSGDNAFSLDDFPIYLLGFCDVGTASIQYDEEYFSIFHEDRMIAKNPFNYTFSEENGITILIITNAEGDKAIYGDELLALTDFEQLTISLFPNPANEKLTVTSNSCILETISIFNLKGQEVMKVKFQQNDPTLNVQSLQTGVYFLKAESDTGQLLTAKFVKR